jgi:zinc D-Ala-D-Ala dipeptidase
MARVSALTVAIASTLMSIPAHAQLPADFVALTDIAPTIREDMRYATAQNFTGQRVAGYPEQARCVLRKPAAEALARVDADLAKQGYGLKVFDCYRPQRAVSAFIRWTETQPNATSSYHPNLTRRALIPEGYIAAVSGHSTGYVVDLTLVLRAETPSAPRAPSATPCAATSPEGDDLDLGTDFDCFSSRANVGAGGISQDARKHRQILTAAMARHGFRSYSREWWHFSFNATGPRFDFPVPAGTKP